MNVCFKSVDYAERYKAKAATDKSRFNQLANFRKLLNAIDEKKTVSCKQILDLDEGIFSEEKQLLPVDFNAVDNRIIINAIEDDKQKTYFLGDLIDVEII